MNQSMMKRRDEKYKELKDLKNKFHGNANVEQSQLSKMVIELSRFFEDLVEIDYFNDSWEKAQNYGRLLNNFVFPSILISLKELVAFVQTQLTT